MLPKTLAQLLEKHPDKIEVIDDDGYDPDQARYWLYLKRGWGYDGGHIIHEATVREVLDCFKDIVHCSCESRWDKNGPRCMDVVHA
jgi:hypothetical protein